MATVNVQEFIDRRKLSRFQLRVFALCALIVLGDAMPNSIALTTEYTPKRIRATAVMIMFCGFSLGAALGGVAAASLISYLGWKSVFVLGGVMPCLIFPLLVALEDQ